MSTVAAHVLQPARRENAPDRRLRALEQPVRRKPRLLYAVVALSGALAIGAAQMGLSVAMTQGGYEERALMQEQRALTWEMQSAQDALTGLSSPQYLAANAAALGMVINEAPTYLRLSDGAVLGAGNAANGQSTVDAAGRGSVPNALVAATPLVTEPDATIQGVTEKPEEASTTATTESALPPALSEGLPAPVTR